MGTKTAPQIPTKRRVNVEEFADVATPLTADSNSAVRNRMAAARSRTDRGALQIPLLDRIGQGFGGFGISIPFLGN